MKLYNRRNALEMFKNRKDQDYWYILLKYHSLTDPGIKIK